MRIFAAIMLAMMAQQAWAQCNVTAQSINFGNYTQFSPAHTDSAGNIGVTCDAAASFSIALSTGAGTYAARIMANSEGHVLRYNLYLDAGRNVVWGDGVGGASSTASGNGTSANYTVYGRIPAGQNAYAGNYGDSIIVTLNF